MEQDVDDLRIYARDLDGTGSMHVCSAEDEGAVRFIREDVVSDMVAEQHITFDFHLMMIA